MIRSMVILNDFLIMNALLALFILLTPVPEYFHSATKTAVITANLAMTIAQIFFSTVIHVRKIKFRQVLQRTGKLTFIQSFAMVVFLKFLSDDGNFYSFTIIFFATEFIVLMLTRLAELLLLKHYRSTGRNTRSVVFVGSDPANLTIYEDLTEDVSTGYKVLGYYSDEVIDGAPKDFKHIGTRSDLNKLIQASEEFDPDKATKQAETIINSKPNTMKIDELFCSLSHKDSEEITRIIKFCDKNVIRFYYVPRSFGNQQLNLQGENFMGYTLFTNHAEPLDDPKNKFLKRAFDIFVSGIILLCFLPFFPIIALIIKIQSPGPIFFKQDRTGMNGLTFQCYKFRSMHVSKDADTKQATKNDPRKFAFGNFMRKTNIDEFPQFINVLKGDMSIVGPRPHMLHHTEMYSKEISKYMVRHFAKPGITGLAQVTGFRGETKELWQMEGRIKRDIWYIENWTPMLDIKIMLLTAKSILVPDKNAY